MTTSRRDRHRSTVYLALVGLALGALGPCRLLRRRRRDPRLADLPARDSRPGGRRRGGPALRGRGRHADARPRRQRRGRGGGRHLRRRRHRDLALRPRRRGADHPLPRRPARGRRHQRPGDGAGRGVAGDLRRERGIPPNGPSAGTVPAVVDALAHRAGRVRHAARSPRRSPRPSSWPTAFPGTSSSRGTSARAANDVALPERGARVPAGPGRHAFPAVGSVFRQPDLGAHAARTRRGGAAHLAEGRKAAIYAARDRFYRGDIGQRIAAAVQDAGGLLTADDLARYRGRVERADAAHVRRATAHFEVFKTGLLGPGPGAAPGARAPRGLRPRAHGPQLDRVHPHRAPRRSSWRWPTATPSTAIPTSPRCRRAGSSPRPTRPSGASSSIRARPTTSQRPGDPWKFEPRVRAGRVPRPWTAASPAAPRPARADRPTRRP